MYFEYSGTGWQHHVSSDWGPCRRLVEVHDDQKAGRQIDFYDNGFILKYDRQHDRDEYGILIGLRFSRKDKWRKPFAHLQIISKSKFENQWASATMFVPSLPLPPTSSDSQPANCETHRG
jgi:hypothetical protein